MCVCVFVGECGLMKPYDLFDSRHRIIRHKTNQSDAYSQTERICVFCYRSVCYSGDSHSPFARTLSK